jgi:aspartate dehydrogenase
MFASPSRRRIRLRHYSGHALAPFAIFSHDKNRRHCRTSFANPPSIVRLADLAQADIVVEAAPSAIFDDIAIPAIEAGRILVAASAGALLSRMHLIRRAEETGGRIIVPTGALLGLDAVRAAAEGRVNSVAIETRKPPAGLDGAPYLVERQTRLTDVTEPRKGFEGNAYDAAAGFPANVNVAAALALAGIGPERTQVEIWADPTITRNTHILSASMPRPPASP